MVSPSSSVEIETTPPFESVITKFAFVSSKENLAFTVSRSDQDIGLTLPSVSI